MTLVVGTNTYLNVADADAYWSARNNSTWASAATADKEGALIEATQYIDGAFDFIGNQVIDQVLAWPRHNVWIQMGNLAGQTYDSVTIPPQIKAATAELALEALSSRLVEIKDRGGLVKREKVDTIEVEYSDFAPSGKSYSFVAMLLKPLVNGGAGMKRLVRS